MKPQYFCAALISTLLFINSNTEVEVPQDQQNNITAFLSLNFTSRVLRLTDILEKTYQRDGTANLTRFDEQKLQKLDEFRGKFLEKFTPTDSPPTLCQILSKLCDKIHKKGTVE